MSINEPLTEDNPTLPLNTLPTDSETQLSSKQRLYISLMKPGRLSYWLAIDDSFMKTIIHYFAFVVFPVLVAVILSTVRYELSSEYVVRHSFSASSWATMNTPIAFTLLIPIVIVVTKCIINLVRYNSIPKHLLLLQFGRVSFFVCGGLSFLLLFLLSTSSIHIEHTLALCPIMIGWLCSIPLMISRIRGLDRFMHLWHQNRPGETQNRLLMWKATMFKAQVISEMVCYALCTFLVISIVVLCFRLTIPCSSLTSLLVISPLLLFSIIVMVVMLASFPILFSFVPPINRVWKRHFGEVGLSSTARTMEIFARLFIWTILCCFLIISVFLEIAWWDAISAQNYVGFSSSSDPGSFR